MQKTIKVGLSGVIIVIFILISIICAKLKLSIMITSSIFIGTFIVTSLMMTSVVVWLQKLTSKHTENNEE